MWENGESVKRIYGYQLADELDKALLKGITDGFFIEDDLHKAASEKNAAIVATRSSGSFVDAWSVYYPESVTV